MKKIKHYFAFVIFLPLVVSGQQTIVNGNFESWTAMPIDQLPGWFNSNSQSIPQIDSVTCFKTADHHSGNYAVKLKTVSNGIDTVPGYMLNANPNGSGGNLNFVGGFPYNSQPTKITGYYKYTTPGNDFAGLLVIFKKNGSVISQDLFKLAPASTYTSFSLTLTDSSAPDTVQIGMVSSYSIIINGGNHATGEIPGSTLYMDDLAFTGSGTMPAISGGDFENWTTTNIESPDGWEGNGDPGIIFQTTDSYKGTYALKLEETSDGGVTDITNGKATHNSYLGGGAAYTGTKDTLIGWYKFTPVGGDIATVHIRFSKNGNPIDNEGTNLTPSSSYTMFSINYSLSSAPDTMRIDISTSGSGGGGSGTGHAGTILIMDEVTLKSQPLHTGIELFHSDHSVLSAYPNPTSNLVRIYPVPVTHGPGNLQICNSLGQAMIFKNLSEVENGNGIELNTESLKPGMYFYYVTSGGFSGSGTFIKK